MALTSFSHNAAVLKQDNCILFDLLFFLNINRGVFFQIVCIICAEASAVREVLVTHNEVVY